MSEQDTSAPVAEQAPPAEDRRAEKPVTMKRYRLLAACQIGGQLREPGFVTVQPSDWEGPRRTVVSQHERIHVSEDSARIPLTGVDEPLYEEVPDDEPTAAQVRANALEARVAELKDQLAAAEKELANLPSDRPAEEVVVADPQPAAADETSAKPEWKWPQHEPIE